MRWAAVGGRERGQQQRRDHDPRREKVSPEHHRRHGHLLFPGHQLCHKVRFHFTSSSTTTSLTMSTQLRQFLFHVVRLLLKSTAAARCVASLPNCCFTSETKTANWISYSDSENLFIIWPTPTPMSPTLPPTLLLPALTELIRTEG